jgi:PiT family inorganic phosphate transporter
MTPKVMFAAVTVYIQTSGIAQKVLPDWLDVVLPMKNYKMPD